MIFRNHDLSGSVLRLDMKLWNYLITSKPIKQEARKKAIQMLEVVGIPDALEV